MERTSYGKNYAINLIYFSNYLNAMGNQFNVHQILQKKVEYDVVVYQ